MFYLARLTSSSSHSLAATIGYARGSELGWRAGMEPGDLGQIPSPAPSPSAFLRTRSPAATPHPGAVLPIPIDWRLAWTAETF
jgi:hypothetical protein